MFIISIKSPARDLITVAKVACAARTYQLSSPLNWCHNATLFLYKERVPWHACIPLLDVMFIVKICIIVKVQDYLCVHYLLLTPF